MKAPELVTNVLLKMADHVRPGVSTFTLDTLAEYEIQKLGGFSYNKGYHPDWARFPYPAVSCISVNNEIVHGVPAVSKILKEGDIVSLDVGVIDEDGNCGDAAMTLPVGQISKEDQLLLHYAKSTLYAGIKKIKNGATIYDLAKAMETKAAERKFVINRQFTGHGIGRRMHMDPNILHVTNWLAHVDQKRFDEYETYMDVKLTTGQIICLEPQLTYTDPWGMIDPNTGWTAVTKDGRKSAFFEHMIRVLDDGYEILTTHIQPFKLT